MPNNINDWFKKRKKELFNWFTKKQETVATLALRPILIKPKISTVPRPTDPNTKTYLNDPTNPDLVINEREPADTLLAMRSLGEMGSGYALGSLQQQALALKIMVNDALVYMASKSPKKITGWAAVKSLVLMPRAGVDLNAYYDRGALRFFYFGDKVAQKNIFACDARPVVTHEFGHAFLDILRPDWWNTQSIEIWAFHEAFGDMTATLNALQYDELIDHAIAETNGDLLKSNILTQLAAEMGIGLYHLTKGENGELPNCLRDMSNVFKYITPETLPAEGRNDKLLSEPHSFSRVFTGAFWELIVKIAVAHGGNLRDGMKSSRDIVARYLLEAVVNAPTTVRVFDAIAHQMIMIDQNDGGKYQKIMNQVFTNRDIIRPQIMMLEDVDFQTVLNGIKEPHEIQVLGNVQVIRTLSTKTMKLSEKLGPVSALDNNPLLDLEITVPNQMSYEFLNNKLVGIHEVHEDEIVDAAYSCLKMLNEGGLVGDHDTALFHEKFGKLVRKQIICTCGKPNYCDPNAPEYGKPWKPANNSGCVKCRQGNCQPQSCECEQPELPTPPKNGCYTKVKVGGRTVYKFGNNSSRKVC